MNKQFLKTAIFWGVTLWLIGYLLGIILFPFLPAAVLGWVIMPIGVLITLWVLFKKIEADSLSFYLGLAVIWTLIAIIFDYFFLVKLFHPADGYYKLDVYFYYLLTFFLPLTIGYWKTKAK